MGRKKYTTEKFIELSKVVHGNKYDYSKSKYIDMHTKISIICPEHGAFFIVPYAHTTKKAGCDKCGLVKAAKSRSLGYTEFQSKANRVHKNKFKYIKNSYIDTRRKMEIICPIHGQFEQKVSAHLKGFGCKKCTFDQKSIDFKNIYKNS